MQPHDGTVQFIDLADQIHRDLRGLSYFPFPAGVGGTAPEEVLASFHLVSVLPGQMRGQHQHPHKNEWLYAFHGTGRFLWREAGKVQERRLAGDQTLLIIPPGVPHTLINDGSEPVYLLAWRLPAGLGPGEPDTLPDPLI